MRPLKLAVPAVRVSVPTVKVAIWLMRNRARAVERQVRLLERGQGRVADRATIGHLEPGVILLAGVALRLVSALMFSLLPAPSLSSCTGPPLIVVSMGSSTSPPDNAWICVRELYDARVLGDRGQLGERRAGYRCPWPARSPCVDGAGVVRQHRQRQLAAAADQEARAVGVGQSAQGRRAAAQADRPGGERRDLAE